MKKLDSLFLAISFFCTSLLMAQQTDSLPSHVYEWSKLPVNKEKNSVTMPILEGSTTSLSHFEVFATTLESGKRAHLPHIHFYREELIIIKEGQVKITIKGVDKVLGPGSVAFIMPDNEYRIENPGTAKTTFYVLRYQSKLPMNLERATHHGGSFMLDWNDLVFKKTEKGGRRDFFNRPTSQLEKFEMHTTALNPGFDSHAPHTHKEEEIILLLKGNVEMYIAGELIKAAPGDVIFLSSGVSHALKNTGSEACEYFAFQWRN